MSGMDRVPTLITELRDLRSRVAEIERQVLGVGRRLAETLANPEVWRTVGAVGEPGFAGDWGNYGNGYAPVGFYLDAAGIVHVEGAGRKPTGLGAQGTIIFTLPVGYRPPAGHIHFNICQHTGAANANWGYTLVYPDGTVRAHTNDLTTAIDIWQLDETTFRT